MKMIFIDGPLTGERREINGRATLGRDSSADITVPDTAVSRVHCEIGSGPGQASVTDLGSTNGTEVNGRRVVTADLVAGDILSLGDSRVRVLTLEGTDGSTLAALPGPGKDESFEPGMRIEPTRSGVFKAAAAGVEGGPPDSIFGSVTYSLRRKIADGGMGSVYEADQFGAEGFIKRVAIKTILPAFAQRESFVTSFIGEARLVANLVHPNIVQIHHLGRHADGYYIAMEHIDGVSLTEFIRYHRRVRRRVPPRLATFIVSRVCRGLDYAHGKTDAEGRPLRLVHRDVSPNNIMIAREGEVKLTDFGVAKAAQYMEEEEEEDCLVGCVEYMSPEQARCGRVDARSDIFSLGLVYFELLTGVRVFQCTPGGEEAVLERIRAGTVPDAGALVPGLPEDEQEIVARCLAVRPEDRYQSAAELGYVLEYVLYSGGYGPTIRKLAGYLEARGLVESPAPTFAATRELAAAPAGA